MAATLDTVCTEAVEAPETGPGTARNECEFVERAVNTEPNASFSKLGEIEKREAL